MRIYRPLEEISVFVLRVLIGWHLLYEGIVKFMNPEWTSKSFLTQSQGLMSGVYQWIAESDSVLNTADFLNTWGLILIGTLLILGLFTRFAAWSGAVLLLLYYLANPPFIGFETMAAQEGNYLIINKTLIEAITLFVIGVFSVSGSWGLDSLMYSKNRDYGK